MPLQRDTYTAYVNTADDDEPTELTATVNHQDKLRGEAAHLRGGGGEREFLGVTTAWVWASLMRQGDYSGPYERFRDTDCAGIEAGGPVTVDPTLSETTGDSA